MADHGLLLRLSIEGYLYWKQEAASARADGFPKAADRMERAATELFADARRYANAARRDLVMFNSPTSMIETLEVEQKWLPTEKAA
jgi:hypothetical protein